MKIWAERKYHTIGDERMVINRVARRLRYDEDELDHLARMDLLSQSWVEAYRTRVARGAREDESPTPVEVYTILLREMRALIEITPEDPDLQNDLKTVERYLSQLNWQIVDGEIQARPRKKAVVV